MDIEYGWGRGILCATSDSIRKHVKSTKRAVIIGISGQDGILLTKHLHKLNYEVFGVSRRDFSLLHKDLKHLLTRSNYLAVDVQQHSAISDFILDVGPHEIYNFAGVSFVPDSFRDPYLTGLTTGSWIAHLLVSMRDSNILKETKLYQSSSSEIYGRSKSWPQTLNTPKMPRSPYGAAKLYAQNLCDIFRTNYGIFAVCGVTYNHESEYRGIEYVTRKISRELALIKAGLQERLKLGSLDSRRDWGYAGEYVEAMHLSLQVSEPRDYIIASGRLNTVEDFLDAALASLNMLEQKNNIVNLVIDPSRPKEETLLVGDPEETYLTLGWKAKKNICEIAEIMTRADLRNIKIDL